VVRDKIFEAFLSRQYEEGMALADASDLLELEPVGWPPYQEYFAHFRCKGLARDARGEIVETDYHRLWIGFQSDYLRRASSFEVLCWMAPFEIFHPNIKAPFICVGRLAPGTSLVDILYQAFEIITYNKVTMREDDALNREACAWARGNLNRFPIDVRPLKRRSLDIQIEAAERAS
jgi:hypothetical protein